MVTKRTSVRAGSQELATASIRYEDDSVCSVELGQLRRGSFDGSVPWRRVRSAKGHKHHPGEYASATTRGPVVHESRLELARLLLADFDAQVAWIYAQPCRLRAPVGGRWRLHVPDFLLVLADGNVRVVNVKPADRLLDPKIAEALAWPRELLEGRGWQYEVWSGADPVLLWRTSGSWLPTGGPGSYWRRTSRGPGRWCGTGIPLRSPSGVSQLAVPSGTCGPLSSRWCGPGGSRST
ncbi:TnsA-like heteromeric transposase endonuclease subunit [Streptomyces sp. QTS137]